MLQKRQSNTTLYQLASTLATVRDDAMMDIGVWNYYQYSTFSYLDFPNTFISRHLKIIDSFLGRIPAYGITNTTIFRFHQEQSHQESNILQGYRFGTCFTFSEPVHAIDNVPRCDGVLCGLTFGYSDRDTTINSYRVAQLQSLLIVFQNLRSQQHPSIPDLCETDSSRQRCKKP